MGEKAAEFRAKGYLAAGLVYSLKATDGEAAFRSPSSSLCMSSLWQPVLIFLLDVFSLVLPVVLSLCLSLSVTLSSIPARDARGVPEESVGSVPEVCTVLLLMVVC